MTYWSGWTVADGRIEVITELSTRVMAVFRSAVAPACFGGAITTSSVRRIRPRSVVEVVSPCPTHWRLDPVQAWDRVRDIAHSAYPVGTLADRQDENGS